MGRAPSGRPWVSANFAMTWDGRISTRAGSPSDFSSAEDKRRFLEIRAMADAVIAGHRTVKADRMTIGIPSSKTRLERTSRGQTPYPLRVLVTNSGRIDPALPLFSKRFSPIHVYSTCRMPRRLRGELPSHAELHLHEGSSVHLIRMMRQLRGDFGIKRLHCEGGGRLLKSLLEADLVDELYLTLCPRIFGSLSAPTLTGEAAGFLPRSRQCRLVKMQTVGDECFLVYRVVH